MPTPGEWGVLVFLGVVSTALAYWLFAAGLQRIETSEGSMLGVDADSLTGANALYERLGYRRLHGSVRYIFGDAEYS